MSAVRKQKWVKAKIVSYDVAIDFGSLEYDEKEYIFRGCGMYMPGEIVLVDILDRNDGAARPFKIEIEYRIDIHPMALRVTQDQHWKLYFEHKEMCKTVLNNVYPKLTLVK